MLSESKRTAEMTEDEEKDGYSNNNALLLMNALFEISEQLFHAFARRLTARFSFSKHLL